MSTHTPATDVGVFAERVLGFKLFDHQLEFGRSPARYRVILAGRQAGKSRGLATIALYEAATRENIRVLLISQGEGASRALLEECATLAARSHMADSVPDESKSQLVLSNGSTITSVPASVRQIRGRSIDLLIVDEAAFIAPEIWQAAEATILAKSGSRVVLASTPWGSPEHFFRQMHRRGMTAPDEMVQAWKWPSTVSPLVDSTLIEHWRATWSSFKFSTEVLAEFADQAGLYFTEAEIEAAAADYDLLPPADAFEASPWAEGHGMQRVFPAVAGVDFGYARDANALVLVSPLDDEWRNAERVGEAGATLYIPWLIAQHQWDWGEFIDYIVNTSLTYDVHVVAGEVNGVGAYPVTELTSRMTAQWSKVAGRGGTFGCPIVSKVWTDLRRKQSGFSKMKGLMQSGRLVLPRHPELLTQLRALEFQQTETGSLKIFVPETSGHDDLALAAMQAVSCVRPDGLRRPPPPRGYHAAGDPDLVRTGAGLIVARSARALREISSQWVTRPEGREKGDGWR